MFFPPKEVVGHSVRHSPHLSTAFLKRQRKGKAEIKKARENSGFCEQKDKRGQKGEEGKTKRN